MAAPKYDREVFSAWLRRWRDAEGFQWKELAEKAGMSYGALQMLTGVKDRASGKTGAMPGAETIARLAYGLGLDVGYVMEKAGLGSDGHRWRNFTRAERVYLLKALHEYELRHSLEAALVPGHTAALPPVEGRRLTEELEGFVDG